MKTIKVRIDSKSLFKKEIEYVFKTYGLFLGAPFALQEEPGNTHINYGCKNGDSSIYIPSDDYKMWLTKVPSVSWVEGVPLLWIERPKHKQLYYKEGKTIHLAFDIIAASFYLLSQQEELLDKRRDTWNCFSGNYTILKKLGILEFPILNSYIYLLKRLLEELFPGEFDYKPLYKNGKKFSVCLIHDVDQPFKGDVSSGVDILKRHSLKLKGINQASKLIFWGLTYKALNIKDPYFNFEDYIGLERKYGFKSTFNFAALNSQGDILYDPTYTIQNSKIIKIIQWIKSQGWQIGLHGSYESYLDKEKLLEEKASLEQVVGYKIKGICQHYLRIDSWRTCDIQSKVGFKYDTSLGYNEALGFRAGVAFPFFPYNHSWQRQNCVLEIPLVIMDSILFNELKLSVPEATDRCIDLLKKVKHYNGCVSILWHLRIWDKREYKGWIEVYKNILEYLSAENAWVTSPSKIAEFWIKRQEQINKCAE